MAGNRENSLNSIRRLLGQANLLLEEIVATPEASNRSFVSAPETLQTGITNSIHTARANPDRDGERPGPSTGIRTLAAVRSLFAPYANTTSSAVRTAVRRGAPAREWVKRFICLSTPINPRIPNRARLDFLQEEGLGEQVITTDRTCDSSLLTNLIRLKFPKLADTEFALMRSAGSGAGKPLIRLNPAIDVPGVSDLHQYRGTIYICPKSEIVTDDGDIGIEPENDDVELSTVSGHQSPETNLCAFTSMIVQPQTNTILPNPPMDHSANVTIDLFADMLTMKDFQRFVYENNEGEQYVAVVRADFLNQLIGVYKDPGFNILKQPKIFFLGEPGRDVGGLTREYFYKCFTSLLNERVDGRYPVFEGAEDYRLPSRNSFLLHSGFFKTLGKLMVHSLVHTGVAFMGLSTAFVEYLMIRNIESTTPITIETKDISSFEIQQVVHKLENWSPTEDLSEQDISDVRDAAFNAEFTGDINYENRNVIKELLKLHNVIDSRRSALSEIKAAFEATPVVFDFISSRPYLWETVFPKMSSITYTAMQVLNHVDFSGDSGDVIKEALEELLQQLEEAGKIKDLLFCWTAWPILPAERLILKVEDNCNFHISTCFYSMTVPNTFTRKKCMSFVRMSMAQDGGFELV